MRTECKYNIEKPYGLHDMRVNKITYTDTSITFHFEEGYVKSEEPYERVCGTVTLEGVDFDYADVMLLSPDGTYGKFQGEKLVLKDFLDKYDWCSFEIVNELYGYNRVNYSGFLKNNGNDYLTEMDIFIYFEGNVVYDEC